MIIMNITDQILRGNKAFNINIENIKYMNVAQNLNQLHGLIRKKSSENISDYLSLYQH
jgi:hypothetical protein